MNIYLVRHGETDWNKVRKLQGQSDIELNEYGRELAQMTAKGLSDVNFDYAFSSPLKRAKETAQIILAGKDVVLEEDDRLKEMSFGVEEGQSIPYIKENESDPLHNFLYDMENFVPPLNGESFQDIYTRSEQFIKEQLLPIEGQRKNVLIVAHGAINRSMINQIADIPLADFWRVRLQNCSVTHIVCEAGKLSVVEESKIYY